MPTQCATAQEKEIVIRYLDVNDILLDSLVIEGISPKLKKIKEKALSRLGVDHTEDTYLRSWLKWLSDLNGLEFETPVHKAICDGIMEDPNAQRFMFWLA